MHHPLAIDLFAPEDRQLLIDDIEQREKLYKAPVYFVCSLVQPPIESITARTLLNKVALFDRATPTDLNVIIHRSFELALARGDDLIDISQNFYKRMMRKFLKDETSMTDKRRVKLRDPS